MKRDPAPGPGEVAVAVAEMLTAARKATAPGADLAAARSAILDALSPLWPHVPPEAVRDVLANMAELAWSYGVRSLPDGLADQTAEWLLEMAGEPGPGPGGMRPVVALASSVAFDRDEDAETLASVAALLTVALVSEPEPEPDEPEPDEYDPGPEVDDEGGMSEYRYGWPDEP